MAKCNFLNNFQTILKKFFQHIFQRRHIKNTPEIVDSEEKIARFIFEKRHIKNNQIQYAAFIPHVPKNSADGTLEASVFRTDELSDSKIWDTGKAISLIRGRSLRGRANVIAQDIYNNNLAINPCDASRKIPNYRLHANIAGWPIDENERILKAIDLVSKASLTLIPTE